MSKKLEKVGCRIDNVFCSTAVRAQSTIENMGAYLKDIDSDEN
jgi:phosphohistidine phosphatase SixA